MQRSRRERLNSRPELLITISPTTNELPYMKPKLTSTPHKLGANQKETAVKAVKHDANFKQSRDIREDRGTRQIKTSGPPGGQRGK